jgi:hypothetical protein
VSIVALWIGSSAGALESIPAFPGAEGFGAGAVGGRGGAVFEVTNLNDSGPGSLREGVEASEPRTIVFRVSGTIPLRKALVVRNPNLTIAGQTAPGDGVCLRDEALQVVADEVVIRYLRVRLGSEAGRPTDSISIGQGKRVILDHCSASWAVDETLSVSTGDDPLDEITVQWCFITESLNDSIHSKGSHGYGSLVRGHRGSRYSFHHNLYAHHSGRSPRPGNYDKNDRGSDPEGLMFDFRNNVIYDWKGGHAGYNGDRESVTRMNYVGNSLLRGEASDPDSVAYKEQSAYNRSFFADNAMDGIVPKNPYDLVRFPSEYTPGLIADYKSTEEIPTAVVHTDPPAVAYERVLAEGGANLPKRDSVDARIVEHVKNRTGSLINNESEVGGWPRLASTPPPVDSDRDGIPDDWETEQGFDPEDSADGALDPDGDGYTNLEDYLNGLVPPSVIPVTSPR